MEKTVLINGEQKQAEGVRFCDYLSQQGIDRSRIAVMFNGEILPKNEYDTRVISNGDEIEIVGFVGGG